MLVAEGRRLFNKNNQLAGGSPIHFLRMFSYGLANPRKDLINADDIPGTDANRQQADFLMKKRPGSLSVNPHFS